MEQPCYELGEPWLQSLLTIKIDGQEEEQKQCLAESAIHAV